MRDLVGYSSTPGARATRVAVFVVAGVVAVVDLGAKIVAQAQLPGSPVDLGLLELRLGYNSGVAFGLGSVVPTPVVVGLTATVTVAVAIWGWSRAPRAGRVERTAIGAALGGAVANVVDRAADGKVTDYLHTGWWPTFNLADVFIVLGLVVVAARYAWFEGPSPVGAPPGEPARTPRSEPGER